MNALQKRVRRQMDALVKEDHGLTPREARRAVYDYVTAEHGAEAIGDFEDYLPKPKGYWTLERLQADALNYTKRTEWMKGSRSAYSAASKRDLLDQCCGHMESKNRPKGYWTPARLQADASKYSARKEWEKGSRAAYSAAHRLGLIDQCCGHMEIKNRPKGYWTPARLQADALNYNSRTEWGRDSRTAYDTACKLGLLDQCCGHMELKNRPKGYWTLERLQADALNYNSRMEWKAGSHAAYLAARRGALLDQCCGHMESKRRPHGYWTLERLQASASKYSSRNAWGEGAKAAYSAAHKRGLIDQCCGHMEIQQRPPGYWTPERLQASASKYNSRSEWQKGSRSGYSAACKLGLLDQCCGHMPPPQNSGGAKR